MSHVKLAFKCLPEYKERFAESSCLMTISVGQDVHEGEKFEACADIVSKHFKSCTMLVDDSLQRYSMAIGSEYTAVDFYEKSVAEGDLWLDRNKSIFGKMPNLVKILRWDDWLNHSNYNNTLAMINTIYNEDDDYRNAIDNTAETFISRFIPRNKDKNIDPQKAITLSIDYLKEECACLCLWVNGEFSFEVYPSKRNLAMTATHSKFIEPTHPNLLLPVAIKFKNRTSQQCDQNNTFINDELLAII